MINKILEYRTSIMGFSIIWIYINHLAFFGYLGNSRIIDSFIEIGSCGVDIFMLLSSMGLYLSLQKNNNILSFYKKRINRILPCFILLFPVWIFTIRNYNFITYLSAMWFILAILIFYFAYPYLYKLINKKNNLNIILTISIIVTALLTFYLHKTGDNYIYSTWNNTVQRIPIFVTGTLLLLGARFPVWIYKSNLIFILSLIFAYTIHFNFDNPFYSNFLFVSYYFLSISIIKYLIAILKKHESINRFMKFIGKYTLEIYLVHMLVMPYMRYFVPKFSQIGTIFLITLFTIIGVYFTNRILKVYYKYIKL